MARTNSIKKALLTGIFALVVCFSMLIGTTYAWFTDSVSSAGNIITAGSLDVEMYWADGTDDPEATNWNDASQTAIFDYDRWEPGYVDVKHVKVSNEGTLAIKYDFYIQPDGEVSKLAEVIDVYFVDPAVQINSRSQLDDSYKIGTLEDVLSGNAKLARGVLEPAESNALTIALKMQESAGNEYQNMSIGSSFKVLVRAAQTTYEEDSFGSDYDAGSVIYVTYEDTKTVAENATVLQTALNEASYGDIILLGAGNWYATKYNAFKINNDGITLVGENGAVLGFEEQNVNSILDVHADNVTIKNIEFNKNKNEYNQCILAIGAENLTVDGCTFYGENLDGGNTPTIGIYIFENLDSISAEANDTVTKYKIINNTFIGAAIGSYKGGAEKVPTDPGVTVAVVSENMLISNNTFVGANILIENWRSWSKEANRDHRLVPTIVDNVFKSPNLCLANTPHSIYLRCYRQGNPDKILPEGYIDAFVANNQVFTPKNDTVVNYGGQDYVLSDTYAPFFRDNATYGIIAYCYGQTYAIPYNAVADLQSAIDNAVDGETIVLGSDFTGNVTVTQKPGVNITIDGDGRTFNGTITINGKSAGYETAGITLKNFNFIADTVDTEACINLGVYGDTNTRYIANLTVENCFFNVPGKVAIKSYSNGDKNLKVIGCTVALGMHSLLQVNNVGGGILVKDCDVYSKNGINVNQSANVTIEGCEIDVLGYAVRFGASSGEVGIAETYIIKDCTLKTTNVDGTDAAIILRATTDKATLSILNTTIDGTPDIINQSDAVITQG